MPRFDAAVTLLSVTGRSLLRSAAIASLAILAGCSNAVLLSPAGDMALRQRDLIIIATCLMLLIIVPVIFLTLLFAWRYREGAKDAPYNPEWDHSTVLELAIWAAPLLIIITLGAITWVSTHQLDPYRPLTRLDQHRPVAVESKPLIVEVVALDWKWLFLYPEQGIATVNELAAPVDRPIAFKITATSVMNAFFVPSLAGMVYAMPGMETKLHAVINQPGVYDGFSSNYSGAGFSHMRFKFHGLSNEDFDRWVQQVKSSGTQLSKDTYQKLAQPSESEPVQRYASVAPNLYDLILTRCVDAQTCQPKVMARNRDGVRNSNRGSDRFDPTAEICTASNTADAMPIFAPDVASNDNRRLLQ